MCSSKHIIIVTRAHFDNTKWRASRLEGRVVLPNEKHQFSVGWRAAQKGGLAGCTTGRASGLHIKAGCTLSWAAEKGRPEGCPFLQPHPTLFCNVPDRLFVQPAGSPFCHLCSLPAHRKFTFYRKFTSSPLALQLVLSVHFWWQDKRLPRLILMFTPLTFHCFPFSFVHDGSLYCFWLLPEWYDTIHTVNQSVNQITCCIKAYMWRATAFHNSHATT